MNRESTLWDNIGGWGVGWGESTYSGSLGEMRLDRETQEIMAEDISVLLRLEICMLKACILNRKALALHECSKILMVTNLKIGKIYLGLGPLGGGFGVSQEVACHGRMV